MSLQSQYQSKGQGQTSGFGLGSSSGWKIAYADFATAMMAFFLVLWLISNTTPEQKQGVADYFSDTPSAFEVSGEASSQSTQISVSDGAMASFRSKPIGQYEIDQRLKIEVGSLAVRFNDTGDEQNKLQEKMFQEIVFSLPIRLSQLDFNEGLGRHLKTEETSEGLVITLQDLPKKPLFSGYSGHPTSRLVRLSDAVAQTLKAHKAVSLEIRGHTSPVIAGEAAHDPWQLSSDRAHKIRHLLEDHGLASTQIVQVMGEGAHKPINPRSKHAAENRRIEIIVKGGA